jgi:hypothetical protein
VDPSFGSLVAPFSSFLVEPRFLNSCADLVKKGLDEGKKAFSEGSEEKKDEPKPEEK